MSNYECYCKPSEGGPCEVWHETWRKARKIYKCIECRCEIKPGERYQYTFIVFQGDPSSVKTCEFCANELKRILLDHDHLTGLVPGELACALVAELRGDLYDRARVTPAIAQPV